MIKKQKQSVKNEQINNDKTIVLDYDQPLTKREDILNVYKNISVQAAKLRTITERRFMYIPAAK